jgi:hypothetical protein
VRLGQGRQRACDRAGVEVGDARDLRHAHRLVGPDEQAARGGESRPTGDRVATGAARRGASSGWRDVGVDEDPGCGEPEVAPPIQPAHPVRVELAPHGGRHLIGDQDRDDAFAAPVRDAIHLLGGRDRCGLDLDLDRAAVGSVDDEVGAHGIAARERR